MWGRSGDSKGCLGGPCPPDFSLAPPVFFLISRLSLFGWHMQGCQMRFVKIPAILSTAPDRSCVAFRKRCKESRDNSYCYATINNYARILPDSLHFGVCVWRDNRTKDWVNSRKQTSLKKLSWQDSLQESLWFEKFCVSSFWSYSKLFIFTIPPSDTDFQNAGLC